MTALMLPRRACAAGADRALSPPGPRGSSLKTRSQDASNRIVTRRLARRCRKVRDGQATPGRQRGLPTLAPGDGQMGNESTAENEHRVWGTSKGPTARVFDPSLAMNMPQPIQDAAGACHEGIAARYTLNDDALEDCNLKGCKSGRVHADVEELAPPIRSGAAVASARGARSTSCARSASRARSTCRARCTRRTRGTTRACGATRAASTGSTTTAAAACAAAAGATTATCRACRGPCGASIPIVIPAVVAACRRRGEGQQTDYYQTPMIKTDTCHRAVIYTDRSLCKIFLSARGRDR
jgi:hypothetical protein